MRVEGSPRHYSHRSCQDHRVYQTAGTNINQRIPSAAQLGNGQHHQRHSQHHPSAQEQVQIKRYYTPHHPGYLQSDGRENASVCQLQSPNKVVFNLFRVL